MRNEPGPLGSIRLADLSLPAKMALTVFRALMGAGYLVAALNIYEHNHDADGDPAMTPDDLRAVYHGLDKVVTAETRLSLPSPMLKQISPGGAMRSFLEKGGEAATRVLVTWVRDGAKEADFTREGLTAPGDPSPQAVIAKNCVRCHNAKDGEERDVPYAPDASTPPVYALVAKLAAPILGPATQQTQTVHIPPTPRAKLVQVTHAHILSIPVFTLIVGAMFLLTGLPPRVKLVLGPLPMIAVACDIASWWLARPFEPFVFVIAAAGAVFGASFGAQVLCVFGSLWFGRRTS